MPKLLVARMPTDEAEERQVRKLTASRHAPGAGIRRARMNVRSGDGRRTTAIAAELGCHPQTVRDGQAVTLTAPARNTAGYLRLLDAIAAADPTGDLSFITDNLSSHQSAPIQAWLAAHRASSRSSSRRAPAGSIGKRGLVAILPPGSPGRADLRRY